MIEGSAFQVDLILDARPIPVNYTWFFDNQQISTSSQRTLGLDSISWTGVQRSDQGSYRVEASNRAGEGSGSFIIEVICESEE